MPEPSSSGTSAGGRSRLWLSAKSVSSASNELESEREAGRDALSQAENLPSPAALSSGPIHSRLRAVPDRDVLSTQLGGLLTPRPNRVGIAPATPVAPRIATASAHVIRDLFILSSRASEDPSRSRVSLRCPGADLHTFHANRAGNSEQFCLNPGSVAPSAQFIIASPNQGRQANSADLGDNGS